MNCEKSFFPHLTKRFFSLFSYRKTTVAIFPDGATIESISETVVVNPGEEAKLSCNVRGKEK
jgi:hypothetical protein